jgi:GDP-mannose transporter
MPSEQPATMPPQTSAAKTLWAVGGYMMCSATLLIGNKYAVHKLPAPSFILWAQLFGTAVAVKTAHMGGLISHLDALEYDKLRAFFPVALIFCATIFTNIKSLEYANVETFMIFRFSTPLCISIADYIFLGRHLPSARSWLCLVMLLLGAMGYALTDAAYVVRGYMFCGLWYFIFCMDQIYLKHVTSTVKMESNWGRVLYSNLLASLPLFFMALGEQEAIQNASTEALMVVMVTVVLGTAMSYYAWLARSLVSATLFTILGNVCKVVSIGINVSLWDKHASPFGIACLMFCLCAAYFYKQAPLRDAPADLPK